MKVVTREHIRGPYGNCKGCGVGTRSHVLEPAKYEEYEIVEEHEVEEYIEEFEEETGEEEIELRYALLERPTVMCHRCWCSFRESQVEHLKKNVEEWVENPLEHVPNIKVFLRRWKYHDFSRECDAEHVSSVRSVRTALKEAMTNVE